MKSGIIYQNIRVGIIYAKRIIYEIGMVGIIYEVGQNAQKIGWYNIRTYVLAMLHKSITPYRMEDKWYNIQILGVEYNIQRLNVILCENITFILRAVEKLWKKLLEKFSDFFEKGIDKRKSVCYNNNVTNGQPNCNTAYCKSYTKHNCAVGSSERRQQTTLNL